MRTSEGKEKSPVGTQRHVPAHAIRTNVGGERGLVEAVTDHSTREGVSAAA